MHNLHEFARRDYRARWVRRLNDGSTALLIIVGLLVAMVALKQLSMWIGG